MKQVLQQRRGLTLVADVPAPPCPPSGVLVANHCSVVSSGTERATIASTQGSLISKARAKPEAVRQVIDRVKADGISATREMVRRKLDETIALGYSSAGTVIEVGANVRGLKVGDRVACGGVGHASHAEIVAVPSNLCARIPDGVPFDQASFATIASIALHGVRLAELSLGERAAVVGCGLVGQIACRLLQASGVEVIAIDLDLSKAERAVAAGAKYAVKADSEAASRILAATGGVGVDAAIVTAAASVNAPLLLAAEVTRERGSVVLVGAVPIEFPRAPLYMKEISFKVSRSYGPGRYDPDYEIHGVDYPIGFVRWTEQRNMESILNLLSDGLLDLDDLIEERVPVGQAADAFERIASGEAGATGAIEVFYGPGSDAIVPEREELSVSKATPSSVPDGDGSSKTSEPKVGLVGPGSFANGMLLPALRRAGAQLEVVGGGSGPSALNAQKSFGFSRVGESAEAVLEDPEVDAVVIATRHMLHAPMTARALRADKHVLVEKPLALTVEELDDVILAANDSLGTLTVGFNRRFAPFLAEARRHVEGPGPATAIYRVAAGSIDSGSWVHDLLQGGGRLLGEGCHFVDSLCWLVGSSVTRVSTVGFGSSELPAQSADNLSITLEFADGSVGTILYVAGASKGLGKEWFEVSRGGRTARMDDFRTLELFDSGGSLETRKAKSVDKGHQTEINGFMEAAAGRGPAPIPLDEIRNVSLATLGAVRSLLEGQPVKID